MNSHKQPILSICIPTYNRANILRSALYSLLPQISEFGDDVEVIISNNCSTDDTDEVIEWAKQYGNFRYYKNSQNIGALGNILRCADKLATGEFCWILGDDDFLRPGAVKNVLQTLRNMPDIDFIYVNLCHIDISELLKYPQPVSTKDLPTNLRMGNNILTDRYYAQWENMIDPEIDVNYFGAIPNLVFRHKIWCEQPRSAMMVNYDSYIDSMDHYDVVFPHVKILAPGLMGKKAVYLGTPWIIVVDGLREWGKNGGFAKVMLRYINESLDFFESLGVNPNQIEYCRNNHMRTCAGAVISTMFGNEQSEKNKIDLNEFFGRFGTNKSLYSNMMNIFVQNYKQMEAIQMQNSQVNTVNEPQYFIDASCDIRKRERINVEHHVIIQKDCWLNIAYDNPHGKYMIEFGAGTNLGRRCTVSAANRIVLGKKVLVGPNVFIADTSHEYNNVNIPIMDQGITTITDEIYIGDGTWIGTNVVIIGNVTIGKGCVIGANSVVNSNIPDFSVAVGNPARVIKKFDIEKQVWVKVDDSESINDKQVINTKQDLSSSEYIQKLDAICNGILATEQNHVNFTGERVVIGQQIKQQCSGVLKEHIARYRMACQYVSGKTVLDAACGTGYGTAMLKMMGAKEITGVDISEETVNIAKQSYGSEKLGIRYMTGNVSGLPFENETFDTVISFETIEHIDNPASWIKESSRILKDNGLFIVSTPNRKVTNPGTYQREQVFNEFHKVELSIAEFLGQAVVEYDIVELYGQNYTHPFEIQANVLIRQARKLPTDNIVISSKFVNHEMIPLKECVDFEPEYLTAVLRKKSK